MDRKWPTYSTRTFMVKIKAHRGEPLNEKADTQAENARQLSPECQQWTTRTQRMTYEWEDSNGVQHVTAWSKAVRNAMLRGGAEYQVQRVPDRAGTNWNKNFLLSAEAGRQSIRQSASEGVQSDLMGAKDWGRRCMIQLDFRKQKIGTSRRPLPGQLSSCYGKVKAGNA